MRLTLTIWGLLALLTCGCGPDQPERLHRSLRTPRPILDEQGRPVNDDQPRYNIPYGGIAKAQKVQKAKPGDNKQDNPDQGFAVAAAPNTEPLQDIPDPQPTLTVSPLAPVPGDIVHITRSDEAVWPTSTIMKWYLGEEILSQQFSLDTSNLKKDDRILVFIQTPAWQQNIRFKIANRKPSVIGFTKPNRTQDGYRVVVRAKDPDGDSLYLSLPGSSNGIHVKGMHLFIEGEAAKSSRSIPLTVSDGTDQKGFVYNFKPKPIP